MLFKFIVYVVYLWLHMSYSLACTHAHARTHRIMQTYICTHAHSHKHTYTHARTLNTHTHTQSSVCQSHWGDFFDLIACRLIDVHWNVFMLVCSAISCCLLWHHTQCMHTYGYFNIYIIPSSCYCTVIVYIMYICLCPPNVLS